MNLNPESVNSNETQKKTDDSASGVNISPKPVKVLYMDTPGGSIYYVPIVDAGLLPIKGQMFKTVEECIEMYRNYANNGGFDIVRSTQKRTRSGLVKYRYVWCDRYGLPRNVTDDTLNGEENLTRIRKTHTRKTGCMAHVRFLWNDRLANYELVDFEDKHNHELIPPEYMHLSRKNRNLKYAEQLFVFNAANANIGPTKAHLLYSNMKGCEQNVNGTVDDFRNWKRDLNVFINESDAQMLVNKMEERKKYAPGFSFEYKLENSQLHSIFWADEVAKCNYKEFSDVMSFDATYRTNRYNLMFVPFTGIDNHRRCVTFAAALIKDETAETYTWLLNSFLKTFEKEPIMIVTNQDKSMKKAIENVFRTAKHRLCMWHIAQKLPLKVHEAIPGIEQEVERDFNSRFDKIVWNMYIEPDKFEEKWEKLMNDFALQNNSWFKHMFEIRSTWIPAYFIETEMFGLMRTTSRSESENAFFSNFMKQGTNLINFMGSFDSAMLRQRSKQEELDCKTIRTTRKLCTKLKIEEHASKLYTNTVFDIIQKEIEAALYNCSLEKMNTEEDCQIFIVNETSKEKEVDLQYKVLHNQKDGLLVCTCRHYLRFGLLCRHCFWVLKNSNIDKIPNQYIMRRWRRNIIRPELRARRNRYGNENIQVQKVVNEMTSVFEDCVQLLSPNEEKLKEYLEKRKVLKTEIENDMPNKPQKTKKVIMGDMYRVPEQVITGVGNPDVGTYKGCGRDKHVMSCKEKAIKETNKKKNICSNCKMTNHNTRTCEKYHESIKKQKEQQHDILNSEATVNKE